MHILEIVSRTEMNGAILHCLLLSRELAQRGHEVSLLCLPNSWIGRQVADDPIRVIHSDLHRWPTDELRRIAGIVRQDDVDVIHTHTSRANFFGVLLRWFSGAPSVATAHSRHFQLHWMLNNQVIAVSEATRQYQRRINFVRGSRVKTIHNFIDYDRVVGVPPDARSQVRSSLGLADDVPLIMAVGDVVPRKGMLHLVEAMPAILASAPETRLLIVGSTWQREYVSQVESTADRLGVDSRILWLGHRDDVHQLLAASDVSVLASLEESLPLAILEAMAAGLPVVATTAGGIPECVVHDETGKLVPPGDANALAEAIVEVLADPQLRADFGQAGRRRVLDNFSADSQTALIEGVFQQVAMGRRAA